MARRVPEGPPPPPVVQRVRLQYTKRGRLRFVSHRDFARALERALRRAQVPMAYSAGFTPHPKISYVGAAPTGVASEAEYVEIGLAAPVDVEALRVAIDAALPDGLDIVAAVPTGGGSLPERMHVSRWRIELPGVSGDDAAQAVEGVLAREAVLVERMTKQGRRELDVRAALVSLTVLSASWSDPATTPAAATPSRPRKDGACDRSDADSGPPRGLRAILEAVVRQVTPTVRPDEVVMALRVVAGLAPAGPPIAVRLAQGPLDGEGVIGDPLDPDREAGAGSPN